MGFKDTNGGRNLSHTGRGRQPNNPHCGKPTLGGEGQQELGPQGPSAGAGTLEGGAERPLRKKEGEMLWLPPPPTTLVSSVRNQRGGRKCSLRNTEQGTQSWGGVALRESRPLTVPLTQ